MKMVIFNNFQKIHRKTNILESHCLKSLSLETCNSAKIVSSTGVFYLLCGIPNDSILLRNSRRVRLDNLDEQI